MSSAVADMPAVPATAGKPRSVKLGHVILRGRLVSARRPSQNGQYWTHLMVLPAPDPYSSPSTVEILATRRLGDRDEDIELECRVGGYKRSYNSTNHETGEVRKVQTADVKLFALDD